MVLLQTSQGALSQPFGLPAASVVSSEPEMWYDAEKAYWLSVPLMSLKHADHFHPGQDYAGSIGDPIRAQEDGRVNFAGLKDSISGLQIEVQVNDTFRYSMNHLHGFAVMAGMQVRKGDVIAFMGMSGVATGPHVHVGNSLYERGGDGVYRTFLYDPELFLVGGKYANDKRIQPEQRYVALNGLGANLLLFPPGGHVGRAYARSMDPEGPQRPGIYRLGTGNRLGPVNDRLAFLYWHHSQDKGRVAVVHYNGERLAIRDEHVHFV